MYHSNVKRKLVNMFIDSNDMLPYSAKTEKKKFTLLALTAPENLAPARSGYHTACSTLVGLRGLQYIA